MMETLGLRDPAPNSLAVKNDMGANAFNDAVLIQNGPHILLQKYFKGENSIAKKMLFRNIIKEGRHIVNRNSHKRFFLSRYRLSAAIKTIHTLCDSVPFKAHIEV